MPQGLEPCVKRDIYQTLISDTAKAGQQCPAFCRWLRANAGAVGRRCLARQASEAAGCLTHRPFQALCHLQRAERKGVFTLVKINDNSTSGFGGLVT